MIISNWNGVKQKALQIINEHANRHIYLLLVCRALYSSTCSGKPKQTNYVWRRTGMSTRISVIVISIMKIHAWLTINGTIRILQSSARQVPVQLDQAEISPVDGMTCVLTLGGAPTAVMIDCVPNGIDHGSYRCNLSGSLNWIFTSLMAIVEIKINTLSAHVLGAMTRDIFTNTILLVELMTRLSLDRNKINV